MRAVGPHCVLLAVPLTLAGCEPLVHIARQPEAGVAPEASVASDPCVGAPADWLFCSGFEEGDFSVWDDMVDGNPPATNQLLPDPGPHGVSGNHVARMLAPAGSGVGVDFVADFTPTGGVVWARWYAYWEPGFDFTIAGRGAGFHAGSRDFLGNSGRLPNGSDWFDALLGTSPRGEVELSAYYRGMYQDCVEPTTMCFSDRLPCTAGDTFCTRTGDRPTHALTLTTGRWTCIELMIDPGAPTPTEVGASGRYAAWIDGVELGPFPDRWLRTTDSLEPSVLWLSMYFNDPHPDVGMRVDDVVVSRTRVGCE